MADLGDLMAALKGEIDRISSSRAADVKSDELSGILLLSIHSTLRDIKQGANSDEFQDLTVLNFVVSADAAGYSKDSIQSYVRELSKAKEMPR